MGCSRILVPVDGSDTSFAAVQQAIELALACEAEIKFLYVVNLEDSLLTPPVIGKAEAETSVLEDVIDKGRRILDEVLDTVPDAVKAKGHCVSGNPETVILREASAGNYDLIVMGSRGLGAIRSVLMGSVSSYVLNNAKCSVMLVKADKK